MALGIVNPNDVVGFDKFMKWLDNKSEARIFQHSFRTNLTRGFFYEPSVRLYKIKDSKKAQNIDFEYCVITTFANVILQSFLPVFDDQSHESVKVQEYSDVILYPAFSHDEVKVGEEYKVWMTYSDLSRKGMYKRDEIMNFKSNPIIGGFDYKGHSKNLI